MIKMVNTVLGPVDVNKLGKTLMHEHFWFSYAGYTGNTLYVNEPEDLIKVGLEVAEKVKAHGVQTIVDPTGLDCGRMPEILKEIAEGSGLNIIFSTGYSYEAEGGAAYFRWKQAIGQGEEELYELYMSEITNGVGKTGIKPSFIKVGTSLNVITPYEEMNLRVAARVSKETGVPICSHTEQGTMGPEVAELLISEGADPRNIVIYHMCGNTDISYQKRVLEKGVYCAYDRFGIQGFVNCPRDEERITVLMELIESGYVNQIMMSQDMVNVWLGKPPAWPDEMKKNLEKWSSTHIFENIIPILKQGGVTEEQIHTILVENPKKLFASEAVEKENHILQSFSEQL
ncbi:phosphotriesterase-related protein [Priestia aryabhattai]|uniref:phosphotriesterase family protein n=1 Tax=Priestia aryabhattai TaxID=412384 RepID=UPI0039819A6C